MDKKFLLEQLEKFEAELAIDKLRSDIEYRYWQAQNILKRGGTEKQRVVENQFKDTEDRKEAIESRLRYLRTIRDLINKNEYDV